MMNRYGKPLLALLALLMLLSACQTPSPGASPTPSVPTMPPANTDGGMLPNEDDPLAVWRKERLFEETEIIIPPKAFNYPVLIAESIELDWEVLREFAAAQVPDGVRWEESVEYFRDTELPGKLDYGDRHRHYRLTSDAYDTDYGQESVLIGEYATEPRFFYDQGFVDPAWDEDLESAVDIRYSQDDAVDIVRNALIEWGIPIDELELDVVIEYDPAAISLVSYPYHLEVPALSKKEPAYSVRFRHVLYDIPVFDREYSYIVKRSDGELDSIDHRGERIHGLVSDFGLRSLTVFFRRVVEVEKHDVPILPVADVIERNLSKIRPLGRIVRIELMLMPTLYEGEYAHTRMRLVPAWCFFTNDSSRIAVIDAATGEYIGAPQ